MLELQRGGRPWRLLIARGKDAVPERELAAACDLSDMVIADRWLPRTCQPHILKADRNLLDRTGGLAIDLKRWRVETVAEGEGEHGWWRGPPPRLPRRIKPASPLAKPGSATPATTTPATNAIPASEPAASGMPHAAAPTGTAASTAQ
jgi:hypothetical protein